MYFNPEIRVEVKNDSNTSVFTAYTNNLEHIRLSRYDESRRYNDLVERRSAWI